MRALSLFLGLSLGHSLPVCLSEALSLPLFRARAQVHSRAHACVRVRMCVRACKNTPAIAVMHAAVCEHTCGRACGCTRGTCACARQHAAGICVMRASYRAALSGRHCPPLSKGKRDACKGNRPPRGPRERAKLASAALCCHMTHRHVRHVLPPAVIT
jgi:hypothetical protein